MDRVVMERYIYQPLAQGSNHIRLLRLLPGHGEDDIRCDIFDYGLRLERPFGLYEAISYTWGEIPLEYHVITVQNAKSAEDRYLEVKPNLYAALRRL
jgi:hypothetical protein